MGRPSKYNTHVEPHLEEIKQMALDMTEEQIATTLGVSYRAFRDMKAKYPPLKASLKRGRANLVLELKSTLIKKARGFTYEEKKIIKEHGEVVREEIYVKHSSPDVAALNLLLKNYDKENWANDPQALELRKQELEIQKQRVEEGSW